MMGTSVIVALALIACWAVVAVVRERGSRAAKQQHTLTEKEAAYAFVAGTFKKTDREWPSIKDTLKTCGIVVNVPEVAAKNDFTLLFFAVELQALRNIFPVDQSRRIRQFVEALLSEGLSTNAAGVLTAYSRHLDEDGGLDGIHNAATLLLHRWSNPTRCQVEGGLPPPGLASLLAVDGILTSMVGAWASITEDVEIVPDAA